MEFDKLKKRTLLSDYVSAQEVVAYAMEGGMPPIEAAAVAYRAGVIAGKKEAKERCVRMGKSLARANDQIFALRQRLAALSSENKPTSGAETDLEWMEKRR